MKRKQKQFLSQNLKHAKPPKNISSLYNDPEVLNNFSKKLDILLNEESPSNDVNVIENFLVESILQASESEIRSRSRRNCKDPSEKKELGKNI